MADNIEDASSDVSDKDAKVCVVYCGDGVCIVVFQVSAGASVSCPFRSTDARHKYGGKGLPPKGGAKLKANFSNPLVAKLERCSVSGENSGCKKKGEKEKSVGGERGECNKGEKPKDKCVGKASGDGGVEVSAGGDGDVRRCMTKEKLDALRRHLGDGRGECIVVVLLLVCYLLYRC